MNLVGKIFVVLVALMSFVFMAFAIAVYSGHKSWREEIIRPETGYRAQLEKAYKQQVALKEQQDELQKKLNVELAAKAQALAKLETYNTELADRVAKLTAEKTKLFETEKAALANWEVSQAHLASLNKENDALQSQIANVLAKEDAQFKKANEVTDKYHQAIGQVAVLTIRNKEMAIALAEKREPVAGMAKGQPPEMKGQVTKVGGEKGDLIEVSLGADDGIRVGNILEVFHDNKYVGRVKVTTVDSQRAVAKFIPGYLFDKTQEGDSVITTKT